ncbi:SusC/RagA family TonB-linked outer membrane protein [Chryseobacterium salivictor]|uniref:TonB-dependent receptor SusC n=1 Tax=Chryseobacterium salivictor TaxID=2547600 RepID=A0A4P6ZEW4_9FLAO|nr:SusC/RagA family TonB-linked outer membrane protein [Chryseobacterium salivictor]QBO57982.1 TonB-dependent receptor SusC [Chryseobacterium salivictor]
MKKLTTSVLAVVLTASFALVNAQKKDTIKTQDIEGVVVTALGIKREKKSLGYASQEVKSDALSDGTTNTGNIASQLSGKVAGLSVIANSNFAGSANMVIRGIKGVAGSSPLVVIDGTPVNNDSTFGFGKDFGNALSDINQEDIASINVLKGAAASALYGERGLNGVILITTKNGRGGEDGSWGVSWTSGVQAGFIDKSTFLKYQDKYGAGYEQDFYTEAPAADGHPYANFAEDASWGPKFDPSLLVYQWDSLDPTSPNYGKATPWVAAKNGPIKFFETPFTFSNTVTLEKGSKGQNIMFSYDNMTSSGLMPNSKMSKNTFTLKTNYDFTPKLHGSFFSTLNLQDTKGRNTTGYSDNIVTNFRQWWQTNVDVLSLRDAYLRNSGANGTAANNYGNVSWNPKSSSNPNPIFWNNPYFQVYESYPTDKRTRSFSIASLTYDLTKNINLMGKVSHDRTNLSIDDRLAIGSLAQTFGAAGNDIGSGYGRQDITKTETNYDVMASYKFDVTDNVNLSGVVGGTVRRNSYNSIYATTEGGLVLRNIYSLANGAAPGLAPSETEYITQTNSGYASASLDLYKILYVDGTYRIDQSSTLPAGDNVYRYGSVTGALILSELVKTDWLKFWKIRANYAEVGGTANAYDLDYYYGAAGFFGNVGLSGSQTRQPNNKLKPQRAKEFEFGTEGSLFNNRVTFDVAYYKTKTINQILTLPISSGSGLSSASINAGRIDNWGYEVQLGFVPVKNANFTWNIDANWSQNRNEVVELLHNDVTDVSNVLLASYQGGVSLNAREGEAWGTLVGSDYVYLNGEKVINASTGYYLRQGNQIIGNVTPDWLAGVRNSMNYKGVSLSFLIDVRHGGDVFSTDMYYGLATGLPEETATGNVREAGVIWPGVNPNGNVNTTNTADPMDFGSLDGYARMPNKRFVYDGSYVKLREAAIGYTLPQSLLAGTFVRDAKISLVGRNLWIISKNLPYADPENMVGGGNRSYGWSIGSLPTTRDIGLNVTLKF